MDPTERRSTDQTREYPADAERGWSRFASVPDHGGGDRRAALAQAVGGAGGAAPARAEGRPAALSVSTDWRRALYT